MKKCDCYHIQTERQYAYNPITGDPIGRNVDVGVCWGTKERDECSCNGDRSKCDFYPEVREKAHIKIYNEGLFFIDKYGNTTTIDDVMLQYKQNSPTYDELYEHWLKTKQND
jgi:hypothetical protein